VPEDLSQQGLLEFNRALGPRVSTKKAQSLLSEFLKGSEGSEASLRGFVERFPSSSKGKAFELIDKYIGLMNAPSAPAVEPDTDPVEFDKPFRAEIEFDPSKNTWYDNPYTTRYADNPKIQAFLRDKEGLLNRRGAYVASEASKGNAQPLIQHQEWLRKQNILPADAKSFSEYYAPFNERYGRVVNLSDNFNFGMHDLQSHAIPEAYFGIVDKTIPRGITGADETRASLLESFGVSPTADLGQATSNKIEGIRPTLSALRQLNKVDPTHTSYLGIRPEIENLNIEEDAKPFFSVISSLPDQEAEADYFARRYGREVNKANLKTSYGTKLSIDPFNEGLVSDPKGPNVKDVYRDASIRRTPSRTPSSLISFVENAAEPYLRDLETFNRLSLLDRFSETYKPTFGTGDPRGTETTKKVFDNSYFSLDPVTSAAQGLQELGRGIRRTPASLLPGAADLIPSPEAVRTGFREGPAAMGRQMGQEFVQSLPAAAVSAGVLATPVMAPLAPGIGAAMVGIAGTRAANEVVRQQTGEGIVSKLRQTIGTTPRTGVASPARRGPIVTPQIRPTTQAQRNEMQRRQNRNELQRRIDLVRERFNPSKLEFGLSELLFGR
jgi:hypothetical protein